MADLELDRDERTGEDILRTRLRGQTLLHSALLNKGTAFSETERETFGIQGLLPPCVSSLDVQVARAYEEYGHKDDDLERHIFLRGLQDRNETLFYRLLHDHITEMMPIIYTPVVGDACLKFSHSHRQARGMFISQPHKDDIDQILGHAPNPRVDVIVVTDGERILGLGDQGVGGMGIPIGKLSLYTLCGGIHPAATLPILLDAGTDNEAALSDPLYLGWRHHRLRGKDYDEFVEAFVEGVMRKFPHALLQWEDFAQLNAHRLLDRYRDRLCTFNDDIQGTAAVTLAGLLAAVKVTGQPLKDQRFVVVGAGSAGTGICDQIVAAMAAEGVPAAEARGKFWLIDREGLLHSGQTGLQDFQRAYAQPRERTAGWAKDDQGRMGLLEAVKQVKPTVLLGVSGQPGLFTEAAVREMARTVTRPIIFPLSNPTTRAEATPADLMAWTGGRALVATGSPFDAVQWEGRLLPIGQCNNAFIFPGMGLGVIAAKARRVTDQMFLVAARTLSEYSPAIKDPQASLFPPLENIREVSRQIAGKVAAEAQRAGVAEATSDEERERRIDATMWTPQYPRLEPLS
jgi:malate dehydrogenase (oxaloacetate-decarboxylating)